jgi:hypothetical protein
MSATLGMTTLAVIGSPGTGKTELLKARMRGVHRRIILDPYNAIPAKIQVRSVAEAEKAIAATEGDAFDVRICIEGYPEENPCERLAKIALEEHAILIVDEAHEWLSTQKLASSIENGGAPSVLKLVRQGRHHEAALWVATQRPGAVSRDLTGGERYIFRLEDARDLNFVRETLGPQSVPRVKSLKDHHALHVLRGDVKEVRTELKGRTCVIVSNSWPPERKP